MEAFDDGSWEAAREPLEEQGPTDMGGDDLNFGQEEQAKRVHFETDAAEAEADWDVPDDDMREAYAEWLWAYVESGIDEGECDAKDIPAEAQTPATTRSWNGWRPQLVWPDIKCLVFLTLGLLLGGLGMALLLSQDERCTRWWFHSYTDWICAWKISRWEARGLFAWGDLLSGSAVQTAALWAMGALNGPFGAAVLTGMATTFLQSSGGFVPQQTYTNTHGEMSTPQQLMQLQWLHQQNMALQQQHQQQGQHGVQWGQHFGQHFGQHSGHRGERLRGPGVYPGPRVPRKPKAVTGAPSAADTQGRRQMPKLTEEQVLALLRARGTQGQSLSKKQKKRQRAWRETYSG